MEACRQPTIANVRKAAKANAAWMLNLRLSLGADLSTDARLAVVRGCSYSLQVVDDGR
jgi:hypothetical protein